MLNLRHLLQILVAEEVDFVLIGGMAAVAQGSSHVTADLDVCHALHPENLANIVRALAPLHPRPRDFPQDLPFVFDEQTLRIGQNFTFATSAGDIDLLGEVAGLGGYEQVKLHSETLEIFGFLLNVLRLDGLILAKKAAGRPKDLRILPELEGLLALRQEEPASHDPE